VKPGATTGDIGHAIQSFVEPQGHERGGADFPCGHGLGNAMFHDEPNINSYRAGPAKAVALRPGMFFTIRADDQSRPRPPCEDPVPTAGPRSPADRSLSAAVRAIRRPSPPTGVEIFTLVATPRREARRRRHRLRPAVDEPSLDFQRRHAPPPQKETVARIPTRSYGITPDKSLIPKIFPRRLYLPPVRWDPTLVGHTNQFAGLRPTG